MAGGSRRQAATEALNRPPTAASRLLRAAPMPFPPGIPRTIPTSVPRTAPPMLSASAGKTFHGPATPRTRW